MKNTKRNRLMVLLAVVSIMVVFIIGCTNKASPDVEEVPTPTVAPTKAETPTPIPTKPVENEPTKEVTQAVTSTITPAEEVAPTETVTPTPEEEKVEVATPTPTPTEEVKVTNTPTPTVKPTEEVKKPTATPTPTKKATVTPTKKVTPKPTPTPTKVVTPTTKPKPTNTPKPTATPAPVAVLCKEMLTYTNEARAKEGLKPYTWGEDLEALALKRAKEAVAEYANGTPHAGMQTPENLAMTSYSSAETTHELWMNSSGHRAVIMNSITNGYLVCENEEYYQDGVVYKAGETVPGKPVRMACAYVYTYSETYHRNMYYWVYVIKY